MGLFKIKRPPRKREVDIFPVLHGNQEILYPAKRNPKPVGFLSAMLCKGCVVALKGDIIGITKLESPGTVMIRSRSQTASDFHQCYLIGNKVWLPRGNITYHLGLLLLAEALAEKEQAKDLLDALEEILAYGQKTSEKDVRFQELLMHLSDELYYWSKWKDGDPLKNPERLDHLQVLDSVSPPEVTLAEALDPSALTDLEKLRKHRNSKEAKPEVGETITLPVMSRFKGPQLGELIESLDLGMHCLLVGPTATGKSLCAFEAFERTKFRKPVFVIEGHESLKEFDLLGNYVPEGSGSFLWRDGVLVEAMKAGGYLFVDEANRMPARTLNILLGVLSRGAMVLTEHGSEEINAGNGFQVVLAMNLGKGYVVNTLDAALLNRFNVVLEFRYLPAKEEEELLMAETGIDTEVARTMAKLANETRRLKKNKELSGEITPRGLFAWATKFKARKGDSLSRLKAAAKVTWMHQVAGTDADGYLREDVMNMLLDLIEAHMPK